MAVGDKPMMASQSRMSWELESTFGTAPAASAYRSWGYRLGSYQDPGPENEWLSQRSWAGSGPNAIALERLAINLQGPLGEFQVSDPRALGLAWGQELNLPVNTTGAYYRHTVTDTLKHPPASFTHQRSHTDADGNRDTRTYKGGVIETIEVIGNEGREASWIPTTRFQSRDNTTALKTVAEPATAALKHYHGTINLFGTTEVNVLNWRFVKSRDLHARRYWNTTNPELAYEYPIGDVTCILTARLDLNARQFTGFGTDTLQDLADDGDLGTALLTMARTADQDEARIRIGSSNDALGVIGVPTVSPPTGGHVTVDASFVCRTSQYEYVDTESARYYPS